MEKHVEDWKRAIVNGKVHSETEISVMKHGVLEHLYLTQQQMKRFLLLQSEREEAPRANGTQRCS